MTERTANGGNGNSNQSTSGGGGSARKHKKHKSSSSSKHLVMDTSVDTIGNTGQPSTSTSSTTLIDVVANDSQLSSISVCNELEIQCNSAVPGTSSSGLTSPSSTTTKPLRLVLKMAQSGSYSPKLPLDLIDSEASSEQPPNGTNDDSSIQSINFVANNSGVPQSSSSSSMPPQLIPLNVDSFQNEFINSMKKSKKLKKSKKKHHHHHHHRSSNHHPVASQSNSDREINNLIADGSSTDILMGGGSDSNHQLLPPPSSSIESSMDSNSVNINANHQLSMNGHYPQLHESSSSSTIKQQPGNCDNLNEQLNSTTTKIEIVNNNQRQQASMNEIDENINPSLVSTEAAATTTSTLTSKYSQRNNQFNVSSSSSTSLSPPKNYSLYRRLLQNGTVKYHANNISQQRPHRSLTSSTILSSKSSQTPNNKSQTQFQRFLHHLLGQLRAKDLQKFFAWPPSDLLEPNYSAVVRNPMDFNTIQKKIDYGLYGSVQEMKFDVRVLCENALHYHPQSSIQYREAARLWHFAKTKVFHREALSQLRQTLFPKLTNAEIGFESSSSSSSSANTTTAATINSSSTVNQPEGKLIKLELNSTNVVSTQNGVFDSSSSSSRSSTALQALLSDVKSEPSTCEVHNGIKQEDDDDDYKLTPQELFRNARKSLGNSGSTVGGSSTMVLNGDYLESKFTVDRPSSDHLSMLRQRADGSTTLGLLSNLNGVDCDEISRLLLEDHSSEMSINIGRMVGKLNEGTTVLCPPYKEPDTNRIRPVRYFNDILHQSSRPSIHRSSFQYSSHLPFLDSSKATISLDESSLLLNTFGGESWDGEHRVAIEEAANNPDFMIPFVDSVLDIVSNGEYSKQSKQEPGASFETELECEEPIDSSTTTSIIDADETKDQLLLEPTTTTTTTNDNEMTLDEICDNLAQQQLNQIDQLLQELREIQYRRLSKTTEPIAPDEREQELAASISQQLVQLIGQCEVAPGEIIDVGAIRKAMGIVVDDSEPQPPPPLPEIITMDCD